jgi:outer membrane protein TolC
LFKWRINLDLLHRLPESPILSPGRNERRSDRGGILVRVTIAIATGAASFGLAAIAWAAGPDADPAGPIARLQSTQAAAVAGSAQLRAERAELSAAAAAQRRQAASGSPYLEWQSEGLGGSGRRPNAIDTLRVGTPFNLPGQIGRARDLVRTADTWMTAAQEVALLQTVGEASRRWLALAATVELEELSSARLERLDAALNLQEARFQLGEIAGTEVRQIDLEHVSESSRLAELRSRRVAAEAALAELCDAGWATARNGDLAGLVEASLTPPAESVVADSMDAGPIVSRYQGDAELALAGAALTNATAWGRAEIEAEWERVPAIEGLPSYDAWGFRVAVPLPIGAAGHRQREEARARVDQADAQLEAAKREVRLAVERALADAESAERRLRTLEPALDDLPFIDRSLSEQFRLGAISYLAYIDGLSRFDRIVEDAINARLALLEARLELAVLLGEPSVFPMIQASPPEEN